jgi:hypothetical protein
MPVVSLYDIKVDPPRYRQRRQRTLDALIAQTEALTLKNPVL